MPAHGSTAARPTIKLGGRSPVKTRRRLQALPPDDASNPDTRVHRLNADDEIVAIRSKLKMSGLQTVYLVKIKGSSRPKKVPLFNTLLVDECTYRLVFPGSSIRTGYIS